MSFCDTFVNADNRHLPVRMIRKIKFLVDIVKVFLYYDSQDDCSRMKTAIVPATWELFLCRKYGRPCENDSGIFVDSGYVVSPCVASR